MSERSPSAAKERAYPFGLTRAEVGLAIDGVAHLVDATHREAAPLLRRLQDLYALTEDIESVAADRPPDSGAQDRDEALAVVCSRAVVLLEALRPWATCGPKVNTACVELTLALAAVPEEAER